MSKVSLSSFCTIVQGGRLRLTGRDFTTSGVRAYGAGGMNGYVDVVEFDRPAVVLSSIGARCGKCFLVDGQWTSLANTQVILPDLDRCDTHFLWYQLNDEARWPRSGTGQPFIKPSDVKASQVWLPPIEEQRRIAAILDKADELRAKRRAAIAHLYSLTQSIFLDMFGDPLRDSAWPATTMGEVGNIITGNTPSRSDPSLYGHELEWIKSDNLNTPSHLVTPSRERLSTEGARLARTAPAGSVLVTCIAGSLDCIGNSAIADRTVAFNQQINAVVPTAVSSEYLLLVVQLSKRLLQGASTGGMKGMLSKSRLAQIPLRLPPRPMQDAFSQRAEATWRLGDSLTEDLSRFDELFASLQERAFSGQL